MKYLSLFTGIGGFELGIQQAYDNRPNIRNGNTNIQGNMSDTSEQSDRATCVGFSEIDKYAIATYQSHFPEHHNYGDIKKINEQELPDFDMLVGGFPCQAFSIAGKRKGFEDTRGTLFFDIARIIKAKQPRLVFLENVKGLLSHDNGETFRTIIATLDELGYDLQWQVLNSKNHGVPQNRERIFIIGHLRGTSRPEVFPFTGSIEQIGDGIKVIGTLETDGWEKRFEQIRRVHGTDGIVPTIPTGTGGGVMTKIAIAAMRGRNTENSPDRTVGDQTEQRLEINKNGTSNTLTSVGKDNLVLEEMKIRRLTPIECERLQGFPANWTIGSDTQRYKQCGNAVTVNVIQAIMEKLI